MDHDSAIENKQGEAILGLTLGWDVLHSPILILMWNSLETFRTISRSSEDGNKC